ncbi:MAG: lamin tail domain-containing protein, partial [Verrucomicrobiota bacterium]
MIVERLFLNVTPGEIAAIKTSGVIASTLALASTDPRPGELVTTLSTVEVVFNQAAIGVHTADLLLNGVPAQSMTAHDPRTYRFVVAPPPGGAVQFSWAAGHGITDTAGNAFPGTGWAATFDPAAPPAPVHISELLALNDGGLEDEDHDTPDWIEILNPGPARIDLAGWHLTDHPGKPAKWTFPPTVLHAGERIVVFASGKDRAISGQPLHTNFKLNDATLALTNPAGVTVAGFDPLPELEGNVSFGLLPGTTPADGENAWRHFLQPTPGAANSSTGTVGAAVRHVSVPDVPVADDAEIPVTARVRSGSDNVTLHYRIMWNAEKALPMFDDGMHGDGVAGDGLYGAVIPAAESMPGGMVRWYVTGGTAGVASRWPVNDQAARRHPVYLGTVVQKPVATPLPVYEVFVQDYAFPSGPNSHAGIDTDGGAAGAFAANGRLYDNVFYRIKGTTSRYLFKRSHRVEFNAGRGFLWAADQPALSELNLNSEYTDPSYSRQSLSLWLHRATGAAAPHFPVRLQMNGDFWQLAFHTLAADRELLEFSGLDPRGALYKGVGQVQPGAPEKETRLWEDGSDYAEFAAAINESQPAAQRTGALYDRVDLPALINYLAIARLCQEADDVWANMVLYRDSEGSGEWRPVPFDLNLSFGQLFYDGQSWNTRVHADMDNNKSHPLYGSALCRTQYPNNPAYNAHYNRLIDALVRAPSTRAMLLRRLRTLADRFLKAPGSSELPIEAELDAHFAKIAGDATLDRARWGWPPVDANFGVYGLGNVSPAQAVADLKNLYLAPRRVHLYSTHGVQNTARPIGLGNSDNAGIPEPEPANPQITFDDIEFNPASGNQDEEFVSVRNGSAFAVDLSDWRVSGAISHRFKAGTVLPAGGTLYLSPSARAFRNRTLILANAAGALVDSASYQGQPSELQQFLTVTEIMHQPAAPHPDAEFVELLNLSPALTLDLAGAHFSAGVTFRFPAGST